MSAEHVPDCCSIFAFFRSVLDQELSFALLVGSNLAPLVNGTAVALPVCCVASFAVIAGLIGIRAWFFVAQVLWSLERTASVA